jgi:hypothetical protein
MRTIRPELTCIHCWTRFAPEQGLWVSEHRDLLGDPLLGPDAQLRFLPSRFDIKCNAIDAMGQICRNIACPSCHLSLPRALLEREPVFVSILGSKGCGKSFFLAAMAKQLRQHLPMRFGLGFSDGDLSANQPLIDYEDKLFLNRDAESELALGELVRPTMLDGHLYYAVQNGENTVAYPRAFSFLVDALESHPNHAHAQQVRRVVVFYDNAGEHFLPGMDSFNSPGTRHLAESRFLLFLFDPTQDPRWHRALKEEAGPSVLPPLNGNTSRQEAVLSEASIRIRRLLRLPDDQRLDRPLIIVLNKADTWLRLLGEQSLPDCQGPSNSTIWALNIDEITRQSNLLQKLLKKHVPEICFAAESLSSKVYYIPTSALGNMPRYDEHGQAFCRPRDILPWNVTTPFLLGVNLTVNGLIARGHDPIPANAV